MKPIAIFYHCLFFKDHPDNLLPNAVNIVHEQMLEAERTGLLTAASEFHAGLNGGQESLGIARAVLPKTADIVLHGLTCHTENRTLLELERWLPTHPDWYVLYFHSKGATHAAGDDFTGRWRGCMMKNAVRHWLRCVSDLDTAYEAVGSHWMIPPATPAGQHIFAGNFWWATSDFLRTLPSLEARDRIKVSGLDAAESRYESEVWLGNGPRVPRVRDYHGPLWNPSKIGTCTP